MTWSTLDAKWEESLTLPDTREIWEWAGDEVELPNCYAVTGQFDADLVPQSKEIFRALRDPTVGEVINQTGVQCIKTLIGELWLLWSIDQNPGPSQWLQTTNDEAKEHAQERFNYLIQACPRVHRYFSENRHDKKTVSILFKHMALRMEGANDKGNVQRKSVKNQMCSEVWQQKFWPPGRLDEAATRLTQFVHNSKRYVESQPGWEDDQMDTAFKGGTQEKWGFKCLGCGKLQPYFWSYMREDESRAGMRWEESEKTRRPNGEWIWSALVPTIRYECIYCGHGHTDDPQTRRRMLRSGEYIVFNPSAMERVAGARTKRSFSYNQLSMTNLSWFETKTGGVKRFLNANEQAKKGNQDPLTEFFQKAVAEPYSPKKFYATNRLPVEIVSDWPEEHMRCLTVDVQETEFWGVVRAWSKTGESRMLWAGRLVSWGDIRAKQLEFKVPDSAVLVDSGDDTRTVYQQCAIHGHLEVKGGRGEWVCWRATKGEGGNSFPFFHKKLGRIDLPYRYPFSYGDPLGGQNEAVRASFFESLPDDAKKFFSGTGGMPRPSLIQFSNHAIKTILVKLRDGKGAKFAVLKEVCDAWNEHMYAEHKEKVYNPHGQYMGERFVNPQRKPNHLWDCEVLQVLAACLENIIGQDSPNT